MTDSRPEFEIVDSEGTTIHISGTSANTNAFNVPTSPTTKISSFLLVADPENLPVPTAKIEISLDGGTNWYPVFSGGNLCWTIKGDVKQIKLKASHVGLKYYGLMNLEAY